MAKRGRPCGFDRNVALQKAMEVFWEKGYEGAQLTDLMAAMCITSPPSLYAAFGSKEALFREAVNLYVQTVGSAPFVALNEGKTARDAIQAMLLASMEVDLKGPSSVGCLVSVGVIRCASDQTEPVRELLKDIRHQTIDQLRKRLEKGVSDGDLSAQTDIERFAHFYGAVIQALALATCDGASRDILTGIVMTAMQALDFSTKQ